MKEENQLAIIKIDIRIKILYFGSKSKRLVKIGKGADNSRNFSQCDSLLMTDQCGAHTFPYIECENSSATVEHEATTS